MNNRRNASHAEPAGVFAELREPRPALVFPNYTRHAPGTPIPVPGGGLSEFLGLRPGGLRHCRRD